MHKTFGRLYIAQTKYDDAIKEYSESIYLECEQYGPEAIEVCSSYFYLGLIFNKQDKKTEVKAFYSKII